MHINVCVFVCASDANVGLNDSNMQMRMNCLCLIWMDGQMDGQMDRWMDRWMDRNSHLH